MAKIEASTNKMEQIYASLVQVKIAVRSKRLYNPTSRMTNSRYIALIWNVDKWHEFVIQTGCITILTCTWFNQVISHLSLDYYRGDDFLEIREVGYWFELLERDNGFLQSLFGGLWSTLITALTVDPLNREETERTKIKYTSTLVFELNLINNINHF